MAYIPAFETQRDEQAPTPWTNCNPASCAMLVDIHTQGRINTSDVELRRADPNGIDLAVGMNYIAVNACIQALFPQLGQMQYSERDGSGITSMTWAGLRTHLANGGGAACGGNYNSLIGFTNERGQAANRWQPNGTFGHMMFFCDYRESDETVLLMDPLGHGDYRGDRVSLGCLWTYIWKNGNDENAIVTAAYGFANKLPDIPVPAPVPDPIFKDVPADYWAAEAINWARGNGITTGFHDGTFRPESGATRAQVVVYMKRLYDLIRREA